MDGMKTSDKVAALIAAYNNISQYLRDLTQIDVRLFLGMMTLQLLMGGWLFQSQTALPSIAAGISMILLDLTLSFLVVILLVKNAGRRESAVVDLANLCEALGFLDVGLYVPKSQLFKKPKVRSSLLWYGVSLATTVILIIFIVLGRVL